jgi:hypothetical protein
MKNPKPQPYTNEMWQFLFSNSLRCLTNEQMEGLCFDLYSRSVNKKSLFKKIKKAHDKHRL